MLRGHLGETHLSRPWVCHSPTGVSRVPSPSVLTGPTLSLIEASTRPTGRGDAAADGGWLCSWEVAVCSNCRQIVGIGRWISLPPPRHRQQGALHCWAAGRRALRVEGDSCVGVCFPAYSCVGVCFAEGSPILPGLGEDATAIAEWERMLGGGGGEKFNQGTPESLSRGAGTGLQSPGGPDPLWLGQDPYSLCCKATNAEGSWSGLVRLNSLHSTRAVDGRRTGQEAGTSAA